MMTQTSSPSIYGTTHWANAGLRPAEKSYDLMYRLALERTTTSTPCSCLVLSCPIHFIVCQRSKKYLH